MTGKAFDLPSFQKHAPTRYTPTSIWSDHHVVLCWLAECTMTWGQFQHSKECTLPHFWLQLIVLNINNCKLLFSPFEGFVGNPPVFNGWLGIKHQVTPSLFLCRYALAWGPDTVATLILGFPHEIIFVMLWLAEATWVAGTPELLWTTLCWIRPPITHRSNF